MYWSLFDLFNIKITAYIHNVETYPKAASLRYHLLLNWDLLAELFEETIASGKEAINIHALTRWIEAAKYGNNETIPEKNESENNQPSSLKILLGELEESLPNTPQEKNLPEL